MVLYGIAQARGTMGPLKEIIIIIIIIVSNSQFILSDTSSQQPAHKPIACFEFSDDNAELALFIFNAMSLVDDDVAMKEVRDDYIEEEDHDRFYFFESNLACYTRNHS